MRVALVLAVLFVACAHEPARQSPTALSRAVETSLRDAEGELLATGTCTRRFEEWCGEFFVVGIHDGFAGGSSYFDADGKLIAHQGGNCLGSDQFGAVPQCKVTRTRELCAEAQQRLVPLGVTLVIRENGASRTLVVRDGEVVDFGGFTARLLLSNVGVGTFIRVESVRRTDLESPSRGYPSNAVRTASTFALPNDFLAGTQLVVSAEVKRGQFEPPRTAGEKRPRESDLERELASAIAEAQDEWLHTGACTARFLERCEQGAVLIVNDLHEVDSTFFDPAGAKVGFEHWGCLGEGPGGGTRVECSRNTRTERVCELALSRLRRTGVTIDFGPRTFEFAPGTHRLEVDEFAGELTVDADAARPVRFTISRGDVLARPVISVLDQAMLMSTRGADPIEPGNPIPLPATVLVSNARLLINATSHYAPKETQ